MNPEEIAAVQALVGQFEGFVALGDVKTLDDPDRPDAIQHRSMDDKWQGSFDPASGSSHFREGPMNPGMVNTIAHETTHQAAADGPLSQERQRLFRRLFDAEGNVVDGATPAELMRFHLATWKMEREAEFLGGLARDLAFYDEGRPLALERRRSDPTPGGSSVDARKEFNRIRETAVQQGLDWTPDLKKQVEDFIMSRSPLPFSSPDGP